MSRAPLLRSSPSLGTGAYGLQPEQVSQALEHSTKTLSEKRSESKLRKHASTFLQRYPDLRRRPSFNEHSSGGRYTKQNVEDEVDQGSELTMLQEMESEVPHGRVGLGAEGKRVSASTDIPMTEGLYKTLSHSSSTGFERAGSHMLDGEATLSSDEDGDDPVDKHDDEDPPDNSPYPQVRASVAATDDISLSINTPRMWILSLLFAILGSATNMFFSLRYPSVAITPVVALLLVHPLGLLWDQLLKRPYDPPETFVNGTLVAYKAGIARGTSSSSMENLRDTLAATNPSTLRRTRLWLAQGRWNEKEHACVYIGSNVSFGFAFATDVCMSR